MLSTKWMMSVNHDATLRWNATPKTQACLGVKNLVEKCTCFFQLGRIMQRNMDLVCSERSHILNFCVQVDSFPMCFRRCEFPQPPLWQYLSRQHVHATGPSIMAQLLALWSCSLCRTFAYAQFTVARIKLLLESRVGYVDHHFFSLWLRFHALYSEWKGSM